MQYWGMTLRGNAVNTLPASIPLINQDRPSMRLSSCWLEIIEKPVISSSQGHPLAHTSLYDASMSTLKQAFEIFCPRETLVAIKIKIFSDEATSALAGFQAGPLVVGDVGFCGGRKTGEKPSEHGKNQPQTHCPWIEPRSHWWEASVIPAPHDIPHYNLNTQVTLHFQSGRPQCWSQNTLQGLCSLMSRVLSIVYA